MTIIHDKMKKKGAELIPRKGGETTSRSRRSRRFGSSFVPARAGTSLYEKHAIHFLRVLSTSFGYRVNTGLVGKLASFWESKGFESLEKVLKSVTAALFSLSTDQVLPKIPADDQNPYHYFPTVIRRFLVKVVGRNRAYCRHQSDGLRKLGLSRAQDLNFLKKGSPLVSDEMIDSSELDHKINLTEKTGHLSDDLGSDPMLVAALQSEIDDIINLVFKRPFEFGRLKFPSQNAATAPIYGTDDQGHPAEYRFTCKGKANSTSMASDLRSRAYYNLDEELVLGMNYHPRLGVLQVYKRMFVIPLKFDREWLAKPAFILEPMKVRPIMMGPSSNYFILMQMQDYLWNNLSRFDVFSLIKGEATVDFLVSHFLPKCSREPGLKFHSGDYKSATDQFKTHWSLYIWNSIAEKSQMSPFLRRMGAKGLVGHTIAYGSDRPEILKGSQRLENGFVHKQTNGQSMGSPISFPVLCILNAAVCALAHHSDWSETRPWNKLPMIINGDDCLNQYSPAQYRSWERIGNSCGLTPSVGKTFFHSDWFQINSKVFFLSQELVEVPYINYSLLSGEVAKGGERRPWWDLPPLLNEFYRCSRFRFRRREALNIFLRSHRDLLAQVPFGVSWFIPRELGGLGLQWDGETLPSIHSEQVALATYLRFLPDADRPNFRIREDYRLSPFARNCVRDLLRRENCYEEVLEDGETPDKVLCSTDSFGIPGFGSYLWFKFMDFSDKKDFIKPKLKDKDIEKFRRRERDKFSRKIKRLKNNLKRGNININIGHGWGEEVLDFKPRVWKVLPSIVETYRPLTPDLRPQLQALDWKFSLKHFSIVE